MIHLVAHRPRARLAVYGPDGHLWHRVDVLGAARGAGGRPPYGPGYPIAPGHYALVGAEPCEPPTPDDGPGRLLVADLDAGSIDRLVQAGRARRSGARVELAHLLEAQGMLAHWNRAGVALRGGGRTLVHRTPPGDPLAPYQQLVAPDDGGLRLHNADLARLLQILAPAFARAETVVFTVLGDPPLLTPQR